MSFEQFRVPEMEPYVERFTYKGTGDESGAAPNITQMRYGNAHYQGGVGGYVDYLQRDYQESHGTRNGNMGVYETTRWLNGSSTGYGIRAVDNNEIIKTRRVRERTAVDEEDRLDFYLRPGVATAKFVQTNDNYAGIRENKKAKPLVVNDVDTWIQSQNDYNPFFIASYSQMQVREADALLASQEEEMMESG